ncbi:hypothetical protein [Risungbinella massiliensis]|uniref:hypothetical protein n=1 Tax=Risungbinella massiliensis TaxID=1329796 RepID=UPI0005CC12A6|nr:hypothetical protein [Risungbinella massiliensis]
MMEEIRGNPIIQRVITQQIKGIKKYGETVNPNNLDIGQWLDHLAEELTDALIYIECVREKIQKGGDHMQPVAHGVTEPPNT